MDLDVRSQVPTRSVLLEGTGQFVRCEVGDKPGMIPVAKLVLLSQKAIMVHLPTSLMIKGSRGDFKKAVNRCLEVGGHWVTFLHDMRERFWSLDNPYGTYKMYLSSIITGIKASLDRIRRNLLQGLITNETRNWKSPALRRSTRVALEGEAKAVRELTKDYHFKEDESPPDEIIVIDLGLDY